MAVNPRPPALESRRGSRVVLDGREYTSFGGCDYLGLAAHPQVISAAAHGLERFGVSPSASRTTSGEAREHLELERELAQALGAPAALLTANGYLAASVALQGLRDGSERALVDELAHASLFDAARAAGLAVETFPHLDLDALAARLRSGRKALVLSDSTFPSRGEVVDLDGCVEVVRDAGGMLVLDDCHATGVLGAGGRGSAEHPAVPGAGVLVVSTLSKALGTFGGFVLGNEDDLRRMREGAAAYAGATPIPAGLAAAARAALVLAFGSDDLRDRLRSNIHRLRWGLERLGIRPPAIEHPVHALADVCGRHPATEALRLADAGLWMPCVDYMGEGQCLRLVVGAAHTEHEVDALLEALRRT